MNLRHITYFVSVAEHGSLAEAARKLHISQPALSVRLKEMEAECGTRLLDRHARGVRLTESGRKFLPYAQDAARAFAAAAEVFRPNQGRLTVGIGINPTLGSILLPRLLATSADHHPELALHVQQGSSQVLIDRLDGGEIDAALCYHIARPGRFAVIPLYAENLVLVGAPWQFADGKAVVSFAELIRFPLVLDPNHHGMRQIIDHAAVRQKATLNVQAEVEPLAAKTSLLLEGGLCTIGPRYLYLGEMRAGRLRSCAIADPAIALTLHLVLGKTLAPASAMKLRAVVAVTFREFLADQDFGWFAPEAGPGAA